MNYSHELEFKIIVENLANTFVNIGITEADVNRATVKLRKHLKNIDVLEEQDKPGFFQKAGDFLKGLTSRVGLTHATSPTQLDQQRKAVVAAIKNYMGSLGNAGITNAVKIFAPVLRDINTWHSQALRTKAFGGPGKAAPGAPAAPGTPPAAPGAPAAPVGIPKEKVDQIKGSVYGPSGTGADGDFSKFSNPEVAKQYFVANKDKLANDERFKKFMSSFNYKESASQANKYSFSKFVESRRV